MIIKWITALSMLWGALTMFALLVQFIPPIKECDMKRAVGNLLLGLPAWAWLIARYLL